MTPSIQAATALQRIKAITLDLDDTLWAIDPVIRRAERTLWEWLAKHYPRIKGTVSNEQVLAMREAIVDEYPEHACDFRFLRKQVLKRLANDAGYSDELVEPAFAIFDEQRNSVQLFDGVIPALEALQQRYTIVALTNGNANLGVIGIDHLFADVVAAAEFGVAKPATEIFVEGARRAGVDCGEVLHVGDNPEIDVDGARRAGMKTAWMNCNGADWPTDLPPPDIEVDSMSALVTGIDERTL